MSAGLNGLAQARDVCRAVVFLGEKVDYQVEIAGHSLNATSYDPFLHETFALNQEVGIILNEQAIQILKE